MANRQYLTPPDIPDDIYCRVLRIPNSPQWVGTLTGVLYPLCFPSAWSDEDGGISPEAAAARFTQIFNDMFAGSGECEDMACCPLRINPYNGRLQQSNDGGLTWFDVEDGPWIDSLYPPFSAMPQPRPEFTEDDKLCAAAATAAYVLRNLYTQTGDTLLNVVAATDWEYASALGSMLSGFLLMIGAVATQPYVAIATLLGIVGVRQQYVDYPLDDDDEERLTCILLEYATLHPSGAVTFDFNGVWGAIDLDSPKNGLVRFLLTMIGPDALNYAGAIDAGLTVDCSPCTAGWCYEFDFTVNDGGWTLSPGGAGNYVVGIGWQAEYQVAGTNGYRLINIERTVSPNMTVTQIEVEFTYSAGVQTAGTDTAFGIWGDGYAVPFSPTILLSDADPTSPQVRTQTANVSSLRIQIMPGGRTFNTADPGGSATLTKITVRGIGDNPFGADNC